MNTHSFVTALKAILPFAAKRGVRNCLTGVHMFGRAGKLIVEATDGHAAARVTLDVDADVDVILERDVCNELVKLRVAPAHRDTTETKIGVDYVGNVAFQTAGRTLESRPLGGRYSDVDRVLVPAPYREAADRGIDLNYLAKIGKSALLLSPHKLKLGKFIGGAASWDNFYLEVPTNHGGFRDIADPAVFVVAPARV